MLFLTLTLNTKKHHFVRITGITSADVQTLALFARGQHKNTTRNPKLNPK